jgi:hypothetical protein
MTMPTPRTSAAPWTGPTMRQPASRPLTINETHTRRGVTSRPPMRDDVEIRRTVRWRSCVGEIRSQYANNSCQSRHPAGTPGEGNASSCAENVARPSAFRSPSAWCRPCVVDRQPPVRLPRRRQQRPSANPQANGQPPAAAKPTEATLAGAAPATSAAAPPPQTQPRLLRPRAAAKADRGRQAKRPRPAASKADPVPPDQGWRPGRHHPASAQSRGGCFRISTELVVDQTNKLGLASTVNPLEVVYVRPEGRCLAVAHPSLRNAACSAGQT